MCGWDGVSRTVSLGRRSGRMDGRGGGGGGGGQEEGEKKLGRIHIYPIYNIYISGGRNSNSNPGHHMMELNPSRAS